MKAPPTWLAPPVSNVLPSPHHSASIIAGRPMVVFPTTTAGTTANSLQVTAAVDVSGSSWTTPVVIEGPTSQKKQSAVVQVSPCQPCIWPSNDVHSCHTPPLSCQ